MFVTYTTKQKAKILCLAMGLERSKTEAERTVVSAEELSMCVINFLIF